MSLLAGVLFALPALGDVAVPILAYHRFGPTATDSMMVSNTVFESHLRQIEEGGRRVMPLRQLVDWRLGRTPAPTGRNVVITVDDGHRSVYTDLLPIVKRHRTPITLFIYPSAISNASYAMTWEQLAELRDTGLFDIQSHTYWHPNFKKEKRRLDADAYTKFVDIQLGKSKRSLEARLGGRIDMLAWPFGLHDDDLLTRAAQAGYAATFTIDGRPARAADQVIALPRYLMNDSMRGKAFTALLPPSEKL